MVVVVVVVVEVVVVVVCCVVLCVVLSCVLLSVGGCYAAVAVFSIHQFLPYQRYRSRDVDSLMYTTPKPSSNQT